MNVLCQAFLRNEKCIAEACRNTEENPDWIEENYSAFVEPNTLLVVLRKLKNYKEAFQLIISMIDTVNEQCITDDVFFEIMGWGDYRDALVISLSHKALSEKQLKVLCDAEIAFECYFELAIKYYEGEEYPPNRLMQFFKAFAGCKFGYMYKEILAELLIDHTSKNSEKRAWLQREWEAANRV